MFNNMLKFFFRAFSCLWEIRPKRIRSYISPCYFIAVFTIFFHCLVISPSMVEGNEISKFGGDRFNFKNGLSQSFEHTFIPIMSDGIQPFQFRQDFASEFDRYFRNSVFSVVTPSDIANKGGQQYSSKNGVDIVKNDFCHLFGLPWWYG